ncbi:MAG: hypothetical protein NTW56_10890 [Alphaproteobacteria bacterium]|nr:hypothetical protein [Alphaproteobacteria bacterium]
MGVILSRSLGASIIDLGWNRPDVGSRAAILGGSIQPRIDRARDSNPAFRVGAQQQRQRFRAGGLHLDALLSQRGAQSAGREVTLISARLSIASSGSGTRAGAKKAKQVFAS